MNTHTCVQGGNVLKQFKTKNGREVTIRRLCTGTSVCECRQTTAYAIGGLMQCMSPEDRRSRYFSAVLNPADVEYAQLSNYHLVLGAFSAHEIVAVLIVAGQSPHFEFAWTTHPDWRTMGLAEALARLGMRYIRTVTGLTVAHIETLSSNGAMKRLALRLGAMLVESDCGITSFRLDIMPPTWRELGEEITHAHVTFVREFCVTIWFGPPALSARWLDKAVRAA